MELEQPYLKIASALRLKLLQEDVLPKLWQRFEEQPSLRSALLLFAQFYCDEAIDAVQGRLLFSELESPDLEAYFSSSEQDLPDLVNQREVDPEQDYFELDYVGGDSNGIQISAFACYCKEGGYQGMSERELFAPYAVFRKVSGALEMQVVGTKYQPWKDGVQYDWAGRFSVPRESDPQTLQAWHSCLRRKLLFPITVGHWKRNQPPLNGIQLLALAKLPDCRKAGMLLGKTNQGMFPLIQLNWQDMADSALFYAYCDWQSQAYLLLKPIPDFSHWRFEKE